MESDQRIVRIGSRKSQLALVQTHCVLDSLQELYPNIKFEVITMSTKGDQILDQPLSKIGEKSLFTKELEIALEDLKVDMVVHSLKDLPSTLPPGMAIGAVIQRDSPYDCVVFTKKYNGQEMTLAKLPEGAVIGTSSLRRVAQLKRAYPKLKFADVRGNLNTRLRKLDESGIYDALVLADAGLNRMGWEERRGEVLKEDVCMYAISQGAMAVECRSFDLETLELLRPLTDRASLLRCLAERALLRTLEGGCSVPIAVHTQLSEDGNSLTMKSGVFSLDGSEALILERTDFLVPPTEGQGEEAAPSPKRQRRSSCPYSEIAQGHEVKASAVSERFLSVKRKNCPYFSGIIARSLPHDVLEAAEQVGISLAHQLKMGGADEILTKAKAENNKLKQIMDEEKRLKEENDALLNKIVTKVTTTTGSKPLDIIKGEVDAHKQKPTENGDKAANGSKGVCPVKH